MIIDSISNKRKILKEFLDICVFEGWNDQALKQAVAAAGFEEKFTDLIFENGVIDIADFFISSIDQEMIKKIKGLQLSKMKVRDKIKTVVKIRLMLDNEHKLSVKKLINFYSHPKRVAYALKNSYKIADLIWYEIGDQSTDFNFYTKRAILSKVYIRTLNYFVDDNSKDNTKTWQFLDQQVEKVMRFAAFKAKVKDCCSQTIKVSTNIVEKGINLKQDFKSPKDLIKKLPFFRLLKWPLNK